MECSLRNRSAVLALALSVVLPGVAAAADNGVYFGGSFGEVSSDYSAPVDARDPVDDDDGLKLIGGFRPVDKFAIEANYVDFGTTRVPLAIACIAAPCPTEHSVDSRALSVSAVGMLALPLVDLYARVGVARWEVEHETLLNEQDEGTDPTYGAGVQIRLGSFALRAEYESFELRDESADLVSLGFTYTFL